MCKCSALTLLFQFRHCSFVTMFSIRIRSSVHLDGKNGFQYVLLCQRGQDTANCSGVLPSLFSTSKFVSEQSRRSLKTRGSFNYEILPDSFRKLRLSSSFYLKTPLDISRILAPIRQLRSCGENWVTTMSRVTSSKTCSTFSVVVSVVTIACLAWSCRMPSSLGLPSHF